MVLNLKTAISSIQQLPQQLPATAPKATCVVSEDSFLLHQQIWTANILMVS